MYKLILATVLLSVNSVAGNADVNIQGIRLAGGSGPYEGRVEISINGVWGTICDNWFDVNDAKVLCRMMNLSSTAYFTGARYGQGIGPIFADRLQCNGHETHIDDCTYNDLTVSCYHSQDVSIICTECGAIDIDYGRVESVSEDGRELAFTCDNDFRSDDNVSVCQSGGNWSIPTVHCYGSTLDIMDIRLANGIGLYDGKVELLVNGTWGEICSLNGYRSNEARVVCNMLGWRYSGYSDYYYYGAGSGPAFIGNVNCKGTETHINQCSYTIETSCLYYYRAAAVCRDDPLNITAVRLADGTSPYDGRLELFASNTWGSICKYVNDGAARTLCRMMNLTLTKVTNFKGETRTTPMFIDELYCYGNDYNIDSCTFYPPSEMNCDSYNGVSLICSACGTVSNTHGSLSTFNGTVGTVTCSSGYVPETTDVTVECLSNGTWIQNGKCKKYVHNITEIRLENGGSPHDGRVELLVNGTWGTVCQHSFDLYDAQVICRMFGLHYCAYHIYARHYGPGTGPIYVTSMHCTGSENHINECDYTVDTPSCSHNYDIGVSCTECGTPSDSYGSTSCLLNGSTTFMTCNYGYVPDQYVVSCDNGTWSSEDKCELYGYPLNISGIRLAGTNGPYHGRVELEVDGKWGTVCDYNFQSYQNKEVICNMFGLEAHTSYLNAHYGEGKGPVYIDRLTCSGNAKHINDCSYVVKHTCDHSNDVSVKCYGPYLNVTEVRLADGTGPYDGRAEIKVNDTWGTICDSYFTINDADAFCNMFGLKGVHYFTGAKYGEGTGPVYIDQLNCTSAYTDINHCPYLFLNGCTHERDISVVCNECGNPEIYAWGVGYFTYNGTTLYADCSYYRTYIGKLSMTCDNATETWITEGECQEYSYPLTVSDIRLVNGNASSSGRVELQTMNTWGTICQDKFGQNEANVICNMIGYPPAKHVYTNAYFGEGSGPIFVDDLNCAGNAEHINDCSYVTYDDCTHVQDVSVVCTDCGDPTPENGYINSTLSNVGTSVAVSCKDGYRLVGDNIVTCLVYGTWSDTPICKFIDCGDPTPDHGSSNTTTSSNGTVASIACDVGYNISGNPIITCQRDDTWTDNTTCVIIDCGRPSPENAMVYVNKTTYGEIAVAWCLVGYRPEGNSTVKCQANGSWELWPECEIIDCKDPTPNKGSSNTTDTTYGTVVEIMCDDGMNVTGDPVIVCQADGTWSDTPVCDSSDCGNPNIPNGNANTSLGTTIEAVATVSCSPGYDVTGSSTIECTARGWYPNSSCTIQDCGDPTPENGQVVNGAGTEYGDTATIKCNTGYELVGDTIITCQDGGEWSDGPTCRIRDCGGITSLPNGYIDDSEGTEYNATVRFRCKDGFLLFGVSSVICNSAGEWSGDVPVCIVKSNISGPCKTDDYCMTDGAFCVNSVCSCKSGIHAPGINKCDIMTLYPYGENEHDILLQKGSVCGPAIQFTPGIPVFGVLHEDLYVCKTGLVSFDRKYSNPTPPKNRESVSGMFKKRTIVAPFHADIDRRNLGGVYYRTYDILNSYSKMKEDTALVKDVENVIKTQGNVPYFEAKFLLIATWETVKPSHSGLIPSKESTFQLVLVSDGVYTFSLFIYGHGLMQWESRNTYARIWTGYTAAATEFFTHPYAFTSQILKMDSSDIQAGVAGLVIKPLTRTRGGSPNNAIDCIHWYNENLDTKQHTDLMASWLPGCPCDISLAQFDPWFWRIRWELWKHVHYGLNYSCVDMFPGNNYDPYGKSCCYDLRSGLWIDQRPLAGSFQRYHRTKHYTQHYKHDLTPKQKCCDYSNHCKLYYDLRPTGSCYRESPYDFGTFWGDPHFQTLDGLNFTFNGLGEYTLLEVRNDNTSFDLHARTERAVKDDGSLSDATVFSAFAAKDLSNASVHVELNKAKNGLILYGNKMDLTTQYYSNADPMNPFTFSSEEGNLVISKRDEALSILFPESGISLNVSVSVQMLSLNTIVPKKFHKASKGLLGNYDGEPHNDFELPNGTILNSDITEREIFAYGQMWTINPHNSAFIYPENKNHSDFHNDTYIPRFLDEVSEDVRKEAEEACNGPENIECVFDYVFTEKKEIAEETNKIKGKANSAKEEIDETIPALIGCDTINATHGNCVSCTLTLADGDGVHFFENNANASFNKEDLTLTYFQRNNDPVEISLAAKNAKGRMSPMFSVTILLCTGCNKKGHCTSEPRKDEKETDHFKYATCVCEPQYEGLDCENEYDGCAQNPCSLGRECIRLSATDQKLLNRSYNCSSCPDGYTSSDETDDDACLDIDECDNSNSSNVCEQVCTNTDGNYDCSCKYGYRIDSRNPTNCRDINECDEALHNCSHLCNNTLGGFVCECHTGYELNGTTGECNQQNNAPNCDTHCPNAHGCFDNDSESCFCKDGYELQKNGTCKDIDECSRGVCPQGCNNHNGSFDCWCYTGYMLEGQTVCKECEIPYWGDNCKHTCSCNGQGADRCDPVRGCQCNVGWQGNSCDKDVDECNITGDVCKDSKQMCVNNVGSYNCECRDGYIETESGECEDLDECLNPELNECDQLCENTIGGYTCSCEKGYARISNTCTDIDECALGVHGCEQMCVNTPGHYNCFCFYGYLLNDDRRTCTQMSNPCKSISDLSCSHYCVVKDNKAECRCRDGYILESNEQGCTDIDECDDNLHICSSIGQCANINGSYTCNCPAGYRLENDERTCTECDEFHYGVNCINNCSCLNGYCDKTSGCKCDQGWAGDSCDLDRDECDTGEVKCTKNNTKCMNTPGNAVCICKSGFRMDDTGNCKDIDECDDPSDNQCDQVCTNTIGSYKCSCGEGFIPVDEKCSEIDECMATSTCHHICENTVGSYRCLCEEGFRLDLTDRKTCMPNTECNEDGSDICGENAACFIKDGNVSCRCSTGFKKENEICKDINECEGDKSPCTQNCNNTEGSFDCSCEYGFSLLNDGITCQECDDWTHGINCVENCSCITTNSASCHGETGHCTCSPGWEGTNCGVNINECENSTSCPDNSECEDTPGSFTCMCNEGYFKAASGECQECDSRHYGEECNEECSCQFESGKTICNHINGSCSCVQGWEGDGCFNDIDECLNEDICNNKAHSFCDNEDGSYSCICHDGYQNVVDECTECTNNTYGAECNLQCDCNVTNAANPSNMCNLTNGECICAEWWMGDSCNEDVDECTDDTKCKDENRKCVNTAGSYRCDCQEAYKENADGKCIAKGVVKRLNITIHYDLGSDIDLNDPDTYEDIRNNTEESLLAFYKKYTDVALRIDIKTITIGSIIVDYAVFYETNDASVASRLFKAAIDLADGASIRFNGTEVNVTVNTEIVGGNDGLCANYNNLMGQCPDGEACVVEDGVPICRLLEKEGDLLPVIIGVSVGGGLVIIIAITVTICLRRRVELRKCEKRLMYRRDNDSINKDKPKDNPTWKSGDMDPRYRTWRSLVSNLTTKSYDNVYDEPKDVVETPYHIPRARILKPPVFASNDAYE